jgi:hypothetical protein
MIKTFPAELEKNKIDLFNSYKATIETMDQRIIFPFSEFQVQPLFSKFWMELIIPFYKDLINHEDKINRDLFINSSVTRSMYITDLLDCLFFDSPNKNSFRETIHLFYFKILKKLYSEDYFSLKSNRPLSESRVDKDFVFFENTTQPARELLSSALAFSYSRNFDIQADNTYEILGPFYHKNYRIQLSKFYLEEILGFDIIVYSYGSKVGDKMKEGVIDLFGHSTLDNLTFTSVWIKDKGFLYPKQIYEITNLLFDKVSTLGKRNNKFLIEDLIFQYLTIRKERYSKLIKFIDIERCLSLMNKAKQISSPLTKGQQLELVRESIFG